MDDIVPALLSEIRKDYERRASLDIWIRRFLDAVKKENASGEDVSEYAGRLGTHAAEAVNDHLRKDVLPDGVLYWNIAERTIRPILEDVHDRVMDAAVAVQEAVDRKNGIGLKAVRPDFPAQRARDLIDKIVELYAEVEDEQ